AGTSSSPSTPKTARNERARRRPSSGTRPRASPRPARRTQASGLSPAVVPLQRRIGGVAAVLLVVVVTFGTLGLAGEASGTPTKPVVVEAAPVASLWGRPTAVGSWLEPFATAALVMILVIFMLLERQDLRNRLISLVGHRHLTVTTRAFDEAGRRVSRY